MNILPPKLLKMTIVSIEPVEYWLDGATDDPYYGYAYKWRYTMQVEAQSHGSPNTDIQYFYDGSSVQQGDWFCAGLGGLALQIVTIESQDSSNLVVIGEDVDRFNLFSESIFTSSQGAGPASTGVIFNLGDDGLPMLAGLPQATFGDTFSSDLENRFRYRNLQKTFVRVNQPGHTLLVGDVIRPDYNNVGQFVAALADANIHSIIGTVTSVGIPGDDWFTFRPIGQIVENVSPALVGAFGDFFYVDPTSPGKLTNIKPTNNARPIYMRLEKETRGLLVDRGTEDYNETQKFDVVVTDGQTEFTMPVNAEEVLYMSINGIENKDFVFDTTSKALTFDPVATGYGVETTDEVFFIYKS